MPFTDSATPHVSESTPTAAMRVLLVCESLPSSQPPGKLRRFEQLMNWSNARGLKTELFSVNHDVTKFGLAKRFILALWGIPRVLRRSREFDVTWVSGLGEVHMLMVAVALTLARRKVIYDACDSWVLQIRVRKGLPIAKRHIPRIGRAIQRSAPTGLSVSYISSRDAWSDRTVNPHRRVEVVPPTAPRDLLSVRPLTRGKIERVVVAADLRSFHNRAGFEELIDAWCDISTRFPEVSLDVFGRGLPSLKHEQINIRGWAENIHDVYAGQAAVYVTNRYGSGVPNKLIEAVAARRPLVVHSSLAALIEPGPWVFTYDERPATALAQLLSTEMQDDDTHYPRLR